MAKLLELIYEIPVLSTSDSGGAIKSLVSGRMNVSSLKIVWIQQSIKFETRGKVKNGL